MCDEKLMNKTEFHYYFFDCIILLIYTIKNIISV